MKNKNWILAVCFVGITGLMSACGKNDQAPAPTNPGQPPVNQPPAPPPMPPVGPNGPNGPIGPGSCVPIQTGVIPFSGARIYVDWANIVGGSLPTGGISVGQMVVGGNPQGGPYQTLPNRSDGSLSMNLVPVQNGMPNQPPFPGYPGQLYPWANSQMGMNYANQPPNGFTPNYANVNGVLSLSPAVIQDIQYRVGSQMGMNNGSMPYNGSQMPMPQQGQPLCVSGIAIDAGHYNNTIYGAHVYLYLNNSSRGYVVYF